MAKDRRQDKAKALELTRAQIEKQFGKGAIMLLGDDSVVDGIEAGIFPNRPERPGWRLFVGCHYCEPDGLGTAISLRRKSSVSFFTSVSC